MLQNKPKTLLIVITAIVAIYLIYTHQPPQMPQLQLTGQTMGTYYSVKVVAEQQQLEQLAPLKSEIEQLLDEVNQQMSTYLPDSELSRFNASNTTQAQPVSPELAKVVNSALQLSAESQGAFDVTLGPLVNLWGFGPDARVEQPPTNAEVRQLQGQIGYQNLSYFLDHQQPMLQKKHPDLYLDLSAIAKGYAVDKVSEHLSGLGLQNFLVDIGGELRASGINKSNNLWRIAVEKPVAGERSMQIKLVLSNVAIATSGDYRNYFEADGVRYSHTIDPKTGRPVTHKLVSATVVYDNCMMADAYATSLMVLGPKAGLAFAKERKLAVILISKTDEGFVSEMTPEMQSYLF